jgi:hypothetical protein
LSLDSRNYDHDAAAKDQQMSPAESLAYRRLHSALAMKHLQAWCARLLSEKICRPHARLKNTARVITKVAARCRHMQNRGCFFPEPVYKLVQESVDGFNRNEGMISSVISGQDQPKHACSIKIGHDVLSAEK